MTAPIPQMPRDIPDLPAVQATPALPPSYVPPTAVVPPTHRPLATAFRLLGAMIAAAGVALELLLGSPTRVMSYFGVQSGVLLALVFALSAHRAWTARRPLPGAVTGAVLLYAVASALTYHLLLAHTTPPFSMTGATVPPVPWHGQWLASQLLHKAAPAAAVLDWLLLTPPGRMHLRHAAVWLLYPLAYLAFTLTRGELFLPGTTAAYLYPFLDVEQRGYRGVLANALLLGLAVYALALLLTVVDHTRPNPIRRRRRRTRTGFRLRPPVG